MNNDNTNMDDLFDDKLGRILKNLGFVFPTTASDFEQIEEQINSNSTIQPECLRNPLDFLGKRTFKITYDVDCKVLQQDYMSNFAQAAREGKSISEEIKKIMDEDKQKVRGKKDDQ